MPLSYYHNALAKCDFKENQSKFDRCTHGRDTHERKCETKNDKLAFKAQNLTGSSAKIKLAFEKYWGLGPYTNITLWDKVLSMRTICI